MASFDDALFQLSTTDAVGLDPQCRLLLEEAVAALAGAQLALPPASAGVYVGSVWTEYSVLQDALRVPATTAALTGSGLNFLVGRVSYTLGFQGGTTGMCVLGGLMRAIASLGMVQISVVRDSRSFHGVLTLLSAQNTALHRRSVLQPYCC